jgi:anti-sigma regulatory factor (Ser/Thr protein kinase)
MKAQQSFAPTPDSVPEARQFVLDELPGLPQPTLDSIGLIVSELATNAVLHAATVFTVTLDLSAETVALEVTDRGPGRPVAQDPPPPEQLHGRGLLIVSRLAQDWGIRPAPGAAGKTVWVKLALDLS